MILFNTIYVVRASEFEKFVSKVYQKNWAIQTLSKGVRCRINDQILIKLIFLNIFRTYISNNEILEKYYTT